MTRRALLLVPVVVIAIALGGLLPIGPALRSGPEPAAAGTSIAAGRVTARIALSSTRPPARSTVKGHLVLTNSGDRPVDLNQGCAPKWEVVLGKGLQVPQVAFSLECGPEPFVVKPGTTRLPFELQVGRRRPGKYRAFLVASDPAFPTARPVRVTVVSAR